MKHVLGIDTGGTYTDAVLYDPEDETVLAKAKAPTTHDNLSVGIGESIDGLNITDGGAIDRVVLSTTLATNAIVEGKGRPTGLILIGQIPKGELPTKDVALISGKINIKGREVTPIDVDEMKKAVADLVPKVEAIAVSGMMSVRNNTQELAVKKAVREISDMPVVCGHELSSKLGYHDRTVTAILNASLIPIINDFVAAVQTTLAKKQITAPVFIVKGDGALAALDFIREKPIETILSGPAASILGALALAGTSDGIVADMGGTTTDTGVVEGNALTLSPVGAKVGRWQTQVDSAKLSTFGLGGDTEIIDKDGGPTLTTHRVLPISRGNENAVLTPTDLRAAAGETDWNADKAQAEIDKRAKALDMTSENYAKQAEAVILKTMAQDILGEYTDKPDMPVIAIGAPAKAWYSRLDTEKLGRDIIIPENYEVANAVGAATAAVEERVSALVRPDEANDGFAVYAGSTSTYFKDKDEAVACAKEKALEQARAQAEAQDSGTVTAQVFTKEITRKVGWRDVYAETQVLAIARASRLKLKEEEKKPEFVKDFS